LAGLEAEGKDVYILGELYTSVATMRMTIDIDKDLLQRAMEGSGLKTRKAVVEKALKTLLRLQNQRRSIEEMWGMGWEGDLEEMRLGWSSPREPL
jgi:Arc/MetJ family transcription regulator